MGFKTGTEIEEINISEVGYYFFYFISYGSRVVTTLGYVASTLNHQRLTTWFVREMIDL